MDEKRSKELSDDALDGVSGGMDITAINRADHKPLHSGMSVTPGGTPVMSVLPTGTPGTVPVGEITGGMQAQLAATKAGLSEAPRSSSAVPIVDVDIAKEMSDYTKDNILAQSPQAMMAQETPPWSQYLG